MTSSVFTIPITQHANCIMYKMSCNFTTLQYNELNFQLNCSKFEWNVLNLQEQLQKYNYRYVTIESEDGMALKCGVVSATTMLIPGL